ncbi:hypothetical protein ACFYY2_15710 [Streptomyces sp. NPDC001822]|uniref:hypothetical protein n=1 Tax=Streptomyces sp. NPDC001822 TaxID=3364614 RepID=UPI003688183E
MKSKMTVLGVTLLSSVLPAATAHGDETHAHSHNGPQVALIATGQVDDPLEDVLEHATVLGRTHVAG